MTNSPELSPDVRYFTLLRYENPELYRKMAGLFESVDTPQSQLSSMLQLTMNQFPASYIRYFKDSEGNQAVRLLVTFTEERRMVFATQYPNGNIGVYLGTLSIPLPE